MKNLFTSILLSFISMSIWAQSTVQGRAVDADGTAQEFVNVLLRSAQDSSLIKGAITELGGDFEIVDIPDGDYFVTISFVGFEDTHTPIFTLATETKDLGDLVLAQGVTLDEVTVRTKRAFIEMKADKVVVNIENSSVNAGNSALEVLEKSPGVTVDKDNNISLRGKQGVLVLINGKNQYMTGDQLSNMLQSMPSENIKSVEIINNPSSKYDAEGNSGVINIQLKKNENEGYNGTFNAGARQGKKTSYNSGLNANYRSGKWNAFGTGSYSRWASTQELQLMRDIAYNGGNTIFDQTANSTNAGNSIDGRLGVDYYLNDRWTLGVLYKVNVGDRAWLGDNASMISGDNAPANYDQLKVDSDQSTDWVQHSANANIQYAINDAGQTLTVDADYSRYDSDVFNTYDNTYFKNSSIALDPYYLRNDAATDIDIMAVKADLSLPQKSGYNFDIGAKYSMVRTNNDIRFEELANSDWRTIPNRTNNFIYQEDISALYANASKSFGKLNVQAGLRLEHTLSEGNSVTLDNTVTRRYTNLFPSVSMSHMIGEQHSLSYTYSRRLRRPSYKSLNPFTEYLDDYTFQKGNPMLSPEYSNSFGVNYGWGRNLFVSLNYSKTTDAITEVIEQVSSENATYQTDQNLDSYDNFSINVSAPIIWSDVVTTRVNLTSFYNDFQSVIPSGVLDNKNWGYYAYVSNEFNISKTFSAELTGNYQSSLIYGLFALKPQYAVNVGFTAKVMDGQGTLKFGVDDIFWTRRNNVNIDQDDIYLRIKNTRDTRRAKLSFTYKFGNGKVKAARQRRTATADETSRIDSGK